MENFVRIRNFVFICALMFTLSFFLFEGHDGNLIDGLTKVGMLALVMGVRLIPILADPTVTEKSCRFIFATFSFAGGMIFSQGEIRFQEQELLIAFIAVFFMTWIFSHIIEFMKVRYGGEKELLSIM